MDLYQIEKLYSYSLNADSNLIHDITYLVSIIKNKYLTWEPLTLLCL